jgi:prolyl oligopeptidase
LLSKRIVVLTVIIAAVLAFRVTAQISQPKAESHEVTDEYFGQKIVDPYRWMEDQKSAEMTAWMKGQSDYTRSYLDRLPARAELLKRISELNDAGVRVSGIRRAGNLYFYYRLAPATTIKSFMSVRV